MSDRLTRAFHGAAIAVIGVFLLAPVVLVVVLSFSADPFITFPPREWGIRQYQTMVNSELWRPPIIHSLGIAVLASLLATVIAVAAVLGISRSRVPARGVLGAVALGPLLIPGVVYAIAAYQLFTELRLVGTTAAFVLAHVVMATPLVLIIMGGAVARVPRELELAAMSLGAGRLRALHDVTLPLTRAAIFAGALLAFSLSMNEVVVSSFLADVSFTTLPVAIFASLRIAVDPVIMAISVSLALLAAGAISVIYLLRRAIR
jgi:ABC-type spermidine/putrescine transport system permease subunit II